MNLYPSAGSRKLTGMYVGIGALLVLAIIGAVCWAVFGIPENLFATIAAGITSITGFHQGAQSMADRSPNYPNVAPYQPPPASPGGPKFP